MSSQSAWLATLAEYKLVTFAVTALVVGYSWWRVHWVQRCVLGEPRRLRRQQAVLITTTAVYRVSILATYVLYTLSRDLEPVT